MGQGINIQAAHSDRQTLRAQALSMARFALVGRHDLLNGPLSHLGVGLLIFSHQIVDNALKPGKKCPTAIGGRTGELDTLCP